MERARLLQVQLKIRQPAGDQAMDAKGSFEFERQSALLASLCVTDRASPCLRLAHFVTSMTPRLGSRWGGSFPLPGRESHRLEAPGLAWRTQVALEIFHQ